jgi:hypothetical protein
MTAQFEEHGGDLPLFTGASQLPPFGIRRVWEQVKWDLFETKDVQDAITASYVWLEDEAGHIGLGFVFTILLCWVVSLIWVGASHAAFVAVAAIVLSFFTYKELRDRRLSKARWGGVFKFNSRDLDWNVETAVFAFGVGVFFAFTPFLASWRGPLFVLPISLVVILPTAYWWLKRKLAFQQAGLPYLFRLANFDGALEPSSVKLVSKLANYRNTRHSLTQLLFGTERQPDREPEFRHILITGDLGTGKTSLCTGVAAEFALCLKKCRYLTAMKLVEFVLAKNDGRPTANEVEFDDGLYLWHPSACDMVVVDDVDIGVSVAGKDVGRRAAHLITPKQFRQALTMGGQERPLAWLGERRSVWVVGDVNQQDAWRETIAGLLGLSVGAIGVVNVGKRAPAMTNGLPDGAATAA